MRLLKSVHGGHVHAHQTALLVANGRRLLFFYFNLICILHLTWHNIYYGSFADQVSFSACLKDISKRCYQIKTSLLVLMAG